MGWTGRVRFSTKVYFCSTASSPALKLMKPPIQWIQWNISSAIKRPERETDQSSAFNAEVKNGGIILAFSHTFLWRGA
jgi:hypothetical protein